MNLKNTTFTLTDEAITELDLLAEKQNSTGSAIIEKWIQEYKMIRLLLDEKPEFGKKVRECTPVNTFYWTPNASKTPDAEVDAERAATISCSLAELIHIAHGLFLSQKQSYLKPGDLGPLSRKLIPLLKAMKTEAQRIDPDCVNYCWFDPVPQPYCPPRG